ncbi:MAG: hypothetical protein IIC75_00885 [Bacteroidetes bacterium]|nr:hypothetical protein [Bacteroidota bacterium]
MKKSTTAKKNSLKAVEIKQLPQTPYKIKIFNREIRYLKVKDVKRAYSKLIQDYCKGLIQNDEAKTLVYLFSGYLQLIRDVEFDQRLQQLENQVTK